VKTSQRVAKNVLLGGLGTAISSALQFAAVLIIARILSVDQFGIYALQIAFVTILQQAAEMGIGSILIRDLAIKPDYLVTLFGAALALEWVVFLLVVLAMVLILPLFHLSAVVAVSTLVMGISGLWALRANIYGAVLRSQEDNDLQALGFVLYGAVHFSLVLIVAAFHLGLVAIAFTYVIANAIQVLCYRLIVVRRYGRPLIRSNPALWKYLVVNALPVGATASSRAVGEQSDVVSLSWLTNVRTVGLYGGAYKLAAGLRFVPQPLVFALFPLYSRAAGASGSKQDFGAIYERSVRTLLLGAIPLAALFFAVPHVLAVGFLGPHYGESAPAIRLLGIAAMLFIVGTPFPALFTALGQQRFLLVSSTCAIALRVVFNVSLIPFLSMTGACCAVALSEGILLGLWISRLSGLGFQLNIGQLLWRPLVASLLIGVILHYSAIQSLRALAVGGTLCGILYVALVVSLGAFSAAELAIAREGLGFVQPFLAQSTRWLKRRPSKP
jgi:O-antigen/teichoic acid export membrane protein